MKILLIHQYYLEEDDPGGSRFNEMTRQWTEKGHQVTVLAGMMLYNATKKRPEYQGKFIKKKQQNGVQVIRCYVSSSYNANFLGRLWGYISFSFSSLVAGTFFLRARPDIIVATSPPLFIGIQAIWISLLKRAKLIFEVRDLWPESAIDTGVLTNKSLIKFAFWFEKYVYNFSAVVNVLTPAFKKKLIEEKEVDENKVVFIPNAADFSLSDDLLFNFDAVLFKKELGFENKFVITYVGAHGVANHLDQLVEAADVLKESNVIFQLIGGGMEKPRLVEMARKRGLNNIVFVDSVPKKEVFKYILASDMGASVLKKVDTFKTIYSNKTFDYMACKKPVFLCIDGVSRELVEEAQCGIYCEPENISEIAEKALKMSVMSTQELVQLGENGYSYAKKHFDRQVLGDKYLELFKTHARK